MAFISDEQRRTAFKRVFSVLHTDNTLTIASENLSTALPIFGQQILGFLPTVRNSGTLTPARVRTL